MAEACRLVFRVALLIAIACPPCLGASAELVGIPESQPSNLAEQAQKAMRIEPSDVLTALRRAVEHIQKGGSVADERGRALLGKLADALNAGLEPNALRMLILSAVDIQHTGGFPKGISDPLWIYGSHMQRNQIRAELWKMAEENSASDAARAAIYARGTMLLAVHGNFLMEGLYVSALCRNPKFAKISGLNAADLQAFQDAADRFAKLFKFQRTPSTVVMKAIDRTSEAGGKFAEADLGEVTKGLMETWHWAGSEPGLQWWAANLAWETLNLAREREDLAAQKAVSDLLTQWRKAEPQHDVRRWLTEALEVEGPPPGPMHGEGVMLPSGEIVPKTDEK